MHCEVMLLLYCEWYTLYVISPCPTILSFIVRKSRICTWLDDSLLQLTLRDTKIVCLIQCGWVSCSPHKIKCTFNSLAPGKFEWNFRHVIFKQILVIDGWGISCEIAVIWMSLDFIDDHSALTQVMAWCRQAPSHYLSQCWPRSLSP